MDDLHGPVVVAGGGGFIGGASPRGTTPPRHPAAARCGREASSDWYQVFDDVENLQLDLREKGACRSRRGWHVRQCYNLAADMGGMGFIENNKARCMLSRPDQHPPAHGGLGAGVERYLLLVVGLRIRSRASRRSPEVTALKEADAYPAMPEDGYGWEKLFSERMCRHFAEDFGLETRVARYHNVYGPHGTYDGGREKAPAAICRKVAEAKLSGQHEIEIWGDGEQTRSFTYIDDCDRGDATPDGERRRGAAQHRQLASS